MDEDPTTEALIDRMASYALRRMRTDPIFRAQMLEAIGVSSDLTIDDMLDEQRYGVLEIRCPDRRISKILSPTIIKIVGEASK